MTLTVLPPARCDGSRSRRSERAEEYLSLLLLFGPLLLVVSFPPDSPTSFPY